MVRILKVKELHRKKKELLVRSEILRETLALEVTNVRLGVALLKKRMRILKTVYRLFGVVVPIGGLLVGRKRKAERKSSFFSQLLSGFNLASRLKALFSGEKEELEPEEKAEMPRH
jgi:hypothetical protein